VSSSGSPPSGADQEEGGHIGSAQGAGFADLAYKWLGDIVPLHSRADCINPSTCFAFAILTGVVTNFISFHVKHSLADYEHYS